MKKLLIILFIGFLSSFSTEEGGAWLYNFNQAKQEATSQNKYILISFSGSDWCKPCIKYKREVFSTSEFLQYSDSNFVLLSVDFPRQKDHLLSKTQQAHNDSLAGIYNPKGYFPMVVIVDATGKVIGSTGYIAGGPIPFIEKMKSIVKK